MISEKYGNENNCVLCMCNVIGIDVMFILCRFPCV